MKRFRVAVILAVVAAAALVAAVAVAHAERDQHPWRPSRSWAAVADNAHGLCTPRGNARPGSARNALPSPEAMKALRNLHAQQVKDMQNWWSKYGQDPSSAAAQKALSHLRQEHRNELEQLAQKYGLGNLPGLGRRAGVFGQSWEACSGRGVRNGLGGTPMSNAETF